MTWQEILETSKIEVCDENGKKNTCHNIFLMATSTANIFLGTFSPYLLSTNFCFVIFIKMLPKNQQNPRTPTSATATSGAPSGRSGNCALRQVKQLLWHLFHNTVWDIRMRGRRGAAWKTGRPPIFTRGFQNAVKHSR